MKGRRSYVGAAVASAALLTLGGIGCGASSPTGPSGMIAGTWTWVQAEGGIFPQVRTPETEGIERTLVLGVGGVAILYENDEEVRRTGYEVAVGSPGTYHDGVPVVRWETPLFGFQEQAIRLPTAGVLVLDDGCCDAFVWTFERVGPA